MQSTPSFSLTREKTGNVREGSAYARAGHQICLDPRSSPLVTHFRLRSITYGAVPQRNLTTLRMTQRQCRRVWYSCGGVLRGLFMALEVCLTHTPCSGRHRGTTSRFQKPCALKPSGVPRATYHRYVSEGIGFGLKKIPRKTKKHRWKSAGKITAGCSQIKHNNDPAYITVCSTPPKHIYWGT